MPIPGLHPAFFGSVWIDKIYYTIVDMIYSCRGWVREGDKPLPLTMLKKAS